jgi:hypothetical protein
VPAAVSTPSAPAASDIAFQKITNRVKGTTLAAETLGLG